MIPIKHILNENGVKQIFKFIVPSGEFAGTYDIEKPGGWDQVDSVVNVDDEYFFVKDFIIGETEKLSFHEYSHKTAFNLLLNVYREQGGDGIVKFKWIAVKNEVEYDLLGNGYDVNMNTYDLSFDKSMRKIEIEIAKSEDQNKFFNREDISVNLFAEKDLDENDIDPVETIDVGYKMGNKILSNFYFYNAGQRSFGNNSSSVKFFAFTRADGWEFGNNSNSLCGTENFGEDPFQVYRGPFVSTNITLKLLKAEISNFDVNCKTLGGNVFPNVRFFAVIKSSNGNINKIELKNYTENLAGGIHYSRITIDYQKSDLVTMQPGDTLDFEVSDVNGGDFIMFGLKDNTSIELTTDAESPMRKVKSVMLHNALDKIIENYSSGGLSLESNVLNNGGFFYNTIVSSGIYLRGLPQVYLNNKIQTSFKNIFLDGAAKLMALGYDALHDKVIVEDIKYFFKDIPVYDLSDRIYIREGFSIKSDQDLIYNNLQFGSKKISTDNKLDIQNFTTKAEFSTPIKTKKNKLDKETELIIDEFKIQELIEDKTTSTNDNDDDLCTVDLVDVDMLFDEGIFENCEHSAQSGKLVLNCISLPFDSTFITPNNFIQILQGINTGTWLVEEVNGSRVVLNPLGNPITAGVVDTPIRYRIDDIKKNRTSEGFTDIMNVKNKLTSTNIRHNPKYQMARWFPFFGSGLRKKANSELIKVTNYKNNSEAQMRINSADLSNELQGLITVGEDETLGRLRGYAQTLFNGDKISISYLNITFEEFISIYGNWRFGIDNDRMQSRGYILLNTPLGIYEVYPFGQEAFKHNKKNNVLTINGKIKGKSTENPTLLSVTQIDKKTVQLEWDFNADYVNAVTTVQYSLDGVNWNPLGDFNLVKSATITNDLFLSIFTGTDVYFRVIVNSSDYYNKLSNSLMIEWQFNDWICRQLNRSVNPCGTSNFQFLLSGTGDFTIDWNFVSIPGGGSYRVYDNNGTDIIVQTTPYGTDYDDTNITNHVLNNESLQLNVDILTTDNDGTNYLNCNYGNVLVIINTNLFITITENNSLEQIDADFKIRSSKSYQQIVNPIDPTNPFEPTDPF